MEFYYKNIYVHIGFWFAFGVAYLFCIQDNLVLRFAVLFSLLHEFGHLAAYFYLKIYPEKILFSLCGMTIVEKNGSVCSYKQERQIAFGGPFVNLCFTLIFFVLYFILKREPYLVASIVNLFIFLFNMLPIFALDGGRILLFTALEFMNTDRAFLLQKCTSFLSSVLLFFLGLFVWMRTKYNFSLLLLSLYLLYVLYRKT